jgi:hypothetical protein
MPARTAATSSVRATSALATRTRAPAASRAAMASPAAGDGALRPTRTRCPAPRSAIQRATASPMAPRPPVIR